MRIVSTLTLGALLLAAMPVLAQNDGFKELVDRGLEAYNQKRYDEAIKTFEQAYGIRPEPELIYNIARAHEKSLRRAEAITAYDRFVNLPGTTAELRTKALSAIEALRNEQAAMERAKAPPRVDPPAEPPPVVTVAPSSNAGVTAAAPPHATPVLPWVLVGVGGAGVVVGTLFGILALDAKGDFDAVNRDEAGAGGRLVSLKDDVDRNALIADISLVAGVGVAAVGVVLLVLDSGRSDGMAASEPMLSPVIGPSGVGLAGRF